MALFQKSVLKRHLNSLDKAAVESAWQRFSVHFLDTVKQENIRNSKEEQYQEGFLRELFVDVLGYVLNPSPGFNLTTELKNVSNAKKADGGIVQSGKVLGIIELKGTETVNLDKVTDQAFGYKSNQKDCRYVLVSNFEKLRLYIDDATDYEEFNLFELTPERFRLLYLLLAADYLFAEMPARIKQESTQQEEDITRKFYKDYSAFKNALFDDLRSRNKQYDPLLLFKKSQKLLDRLLFIFFGEDKGLLPPNLVKKTIDDWDRLRELDEPRPLYDLFKRYFNYINEGTDRKDVNIFAYNGGLFETDEVLDNLKITDFVLYKYTQEISKYDFESEVDVNILGHIFEHSLNEIEEISAQLEGIAFDKTQTKRKKDGVFYTPRYITQYIVENTLGRLCNEQKAALGIVEAEYAQERKGRRKDVMKALDQRLDTYRQWLFGLKICDPACGSGAFLNEAFDFLIKEHGYVAELHKYLFGDSIAFSVENRILESNIYGVDINEEAVEIARLALWLRSASPGRKLTHLSGHIKVGNSLIDDPAVAGDKAFDWEREFPEVFPPKDLQAFHVVLTTHNSRTSQRMIQYRVEKGPALWLIPEHELLITRLIGEVIQDYGFRCMEYMVCADHIHMVLVCEPEELTDVVRTIKSISARKFNLATGRTTPASPSSTPTELPLPRGLDIPRGLAPLPTDTPSPTENSGITRGQAPWKAEAGTKPK
ncbi:MAG: N-6 DNA methylase [Saprospiraceae bacterium]|nr:N-6 DNA methylase [Saprospiraceae bacterium]